jgi:hypothetical protein
MEDDFIVASLDLMSGMAEGMGGSVESLVASSRLLVPYDGHAPALIDCCQVAPPPPPPPVTPPLPPAQGAHALPWAWGGHQACDYRAVRASAREMPLPAGCGLKGSGC